MKALVTGASGFIGSHLCRLLAESGADLVTLGRNPLGYRHVALHDVRDQRTIIAAVRDLRPSHLFHLAGTTDPAQAEVVNATFAETILTALQLHSPRTRALLVGTAAEYGEVAEVNLPVSEAQPCQPDSIYGATKLEQTRLAQRVALGGLRVILARCFNVLGPGMGTQLLPGRVAGHIRAMRAGQAAPELGVGSLSSTRDFIDVRDAVRCLAALIQAEFVPGQVVNVCTGQETSVRTLVERMIRMSGIGVQLIENDAPARASVARSVGSPKLLRLLTGLEPHFEAERSLSALLKSP